MSLGRCPSRGRVMPTICVIGWSRQAQLGDNHQLTPIGPLGGANDKHFTRFYINFLDSPQTASGSGHTGSDHLLFKIAETRHSCAAALSPPTLQLAAQRPTNKGSCSVPVIDVLRRHYRAESSSFDLDTFNTWLRVLPIVAATYVYAVPKDVPRVTVVEPHYSFTLASLTF